MPNYDRLSAADRTFLEIETANVYMHISAVMVFDAGPLLTEDGGIDVERVRKFVGSLLHRMPRYRQKLAFVPLENQPVWVDDHHFNLDYHIRHTSLPRPGHDAQLKRLAGRINSQPLDRGKPMWETWVIEGLEGDRFALLTKCHHSMVDGVGSVEMMKSLIKFVPRTTIPEPRPYVPRPVPGPMTLLRDSLLRRTFAPLEAATSLRRFWTERENPAEEMRSRIRELGKTLGGALTNASETPLNGPIGPHRRFDWRQMDLADVKKIRHALGGTVNDVVLATVAGAVRRFLQRRTVDVRDLDFRVMAPVSMRSEDDREALGNRIANWFLNLPVDEPDPRRRLDKVKEITAELKQSNRALGADVLVQASEWMGTLLLTLASRLSSGGLPYNMVVTNVPGPQVPAYMLGCELLEVYPQVPLSGNHALGVALFSYAGKLNWGFNADADKLPDLDAFCDAVEESFRELQETAEAAPA